MQMKLNDANQLSKLHCSSLFQSISVFKISHDTFLHFIGVTVHKNNGSYLMFYNSNQLLSLPLYTVKPMARERLSSDFFLFFIPFEIINKKVQFLEILRSQFYLGYCKNFFPEYFILVGL